MECYDEDEDCCDKVALASSGLLQSVHPDILDTYSFYTGHSSNTVFSQAQVCQSLYRVVR